jgi:hypothetical protein
MFSGVIATKPRVTVVRVKRKRAEEVQDTISASPVVLFIPSDKVHQARTFGNTWNRESETKGVPMPILVSLKHRYHYVSDHIGLVIFCVLQRRLRDMTVFLTHLGFRIF